MKIYLELSLGCIAIILVQNSTHPGLMLVILAMGGGENVTNRCLR